MLENAHCLSIEEILKKSDTTLEGLNNKEVRLRQRKYGLNEPLKAKKRSSFSIFIDQFKSPLVYLLIIASLITFQLGKNLDTLLIICIVIINAIVGFIQENKAQNALEALKKIISLKTKVRREDEEHEISSLDLVFGDVVILEPGMKVSADLRIIDCDSLKIDESLLTGESAPVYKDPRVLAKNTPLADRKNMAFSGTMVVTGRGLAVVAATGVKTELGLIAKEALSKEDEPTPLHKQISTLSKILLWIVIISSILIFITGIFKGNNITQMFLTSVAVAISVIPEGLLAIITITLAVGVNRMVKKKVLTRKLAAVESLGSVTLLAADKTGTLTKNKMTLERLVINGEIFKVSGDGYAPKGQITTIENEAVKKNELIEKFFLTCILCTNSKIFEENGLWYSEGDPTESALIAAGAKIRVFQGILENKYPRLDEIPFCEEATYMATLNKYKSENLLAVKGSLEKILSRSTHILTAKGITKLSKTEKNLIFSQSNQLAEQGYRILAGAYKKMPQSTHNIDDRNISDLIFIGFCGLDDPPREEAIRAVEKCHQAGVRVIMLTGDFSRTAKAIAQKLGIIDSFGRVASGEEIEVMTNTELKMLTKNVNVYARINPHQKLRIVEVLRAQGEIVGVTGDGVNDMPVLKSADIGISMGIGGTDAAKEVSDMVLLNNDFSNIIHAISEGRTILRNIKRAIFFLLSTNFGELLIISTSVFAGLPLPLTAVQILWINSITDTTSGLALALEPKHTDVLKKPPVLKSERIISNPMFWRIMLVAITMTVITMMVFSIELKNNVPIDETRSLIFALMSVLQLVNLFNCRSFKESIFSLDIYSNPWIWLSFLLSLVLTIGTIELPILQKLFHTVSLSWSQWLMILGLSLIVILVVEIDKYLKKNSNIKY